MKICLDCGKVVEKVVWGGHAIGFDLCGPVIEIKNPRWYIVIPMEDMGSYNLYYFVCVDETQGIYEELGKCDYFGAWDASVVIGPFDTIPDDNTKRIVLARGAE